MTDYSVESCLLPACPLPEPHHSVLVSLRFLPWMPSMAGAFGIWKKSVGCSNFLSELVSSLALSHAWVDCAPALGGGGPEVTLFYRTPAGLRVQDLAALVPARGGHQLGWFLNSVGHTQVPELTLESPIFCPTPGLGWLLGGAGTESSWSWTYHCPLMPSKPNAQSWGRAGEDHALRG